MSNDQTELVSRVSPSGVLRGRSARRILFVITDLDVGGAEKCCVELALGLDRSRWRPAVCCLAPPGALAKRLTEAGVPVYSLHARGVWDTPRAVVRLARLMGTLRPAIVHTFLFHANVMGRIVARWFGSARVVSSVRVAERRYRYHLVLENITCRWADRIVCVSRAVAEFMRRRAHLPAGRMAVVPNGVAVVDGSVVAADRTGLGVPADAVVALYVGRLDRQKGIDVLLRAMSAAQRSMPRLHLWLAGAGPERDALVAQAHELGLDSRVQFLGFRDDVQSLMKAADFVVLPSRWEGMPNVVLEAMAARRAVVATRVEGSAELVRDGETGRLVGVDRPAELAAAMLELSSDAELRARWGPRGSEVARAEFSMVRMIERYEHVYESELCHPPLISGCA